MLGRYWDRQGRFKVGKEVVKVSAGHPLFTLRFLERGAIQRPQRH